MSRRHPLLTAALLCALSLAGCAAVGGEEVKVEEVVNQALDGGRAESVCDLFTEDGLEALTRVEGDAARRACEERYGEDYERLEGVEVAETEIDGDEAEVTLEADGRSGELELVKDDGEWRIDGAGDTAHALFVGTGCDFTSFPSEGNQHSEGTPEHRSNPPHSGTHDPVPADDGIYDEAPPIGMLVHGLEHGRIVLHYRPGAPEEVRESLRELVEEDEEQMILTPNDTDMGFEVAATAWTKVLGCGSASEEALDRIREFRDRFRDRGPERVP